MGRVRVAREIRVRRGDQKGVDHQHPVASSSGAQNAEAGTLLGHLASEGERQRRRHREHSTMYMSPLDNRKAMDTKLLLLFCNIICCAIFRLAVSKLSGIPCNVLLYKNLHKECFSQPIVCLYFLKLKQLY